MLQNVPRVSNQLSWLQYTLTSGESGGLFFRLRDPSVPEWLVEPPVSLPCANPQWTAYTTPDRVARKPLEACGKLWL